MRFSLFVLLVLLFGCSPAPLEIPEQLTLENPETLILETVPPETVTLNWAPEPIEDFIISQNADGFSGRDAYQDFAVGQLISERVEDYIGTVSRVIADSDHRALVRIEGAGLNYKYAWKTLEYVKLTVNAEITIDGKSRSKVYYRQIVDQPEMLPKAMLQSVFDGVSIEMGQDILEMLAR